MSPYVISINEYTSELPEDLFKSRDFFISNIMGIITEQLGNTINNDIEIVFPVCLTTAQRRIIHCFSKKNEIMSRTIRFPNDINQLTLWISKEFVKKNTKVSNFNQLMQTILTEHRSEFRKYIMGMTIVQELDLLNI
jgi:hypothetical protein